VAEVDVVVVEEAVAAADSEEAGGVAGSADAMEEGTADGMVAEAVEIGLPTAVAVVHRMEVVGRHTGEEVWEDTHRRRRACMDSRAGAVAVTVPQEECRVVMVPHRRMDIGRLTFYNIVNGKCSQYRRLGLVKGLVLVSRPRCHHSTYSVLYVQKVFWQFHKKRASALEQIIINFGLLCCITCEGRPTP
jgi:hypothetical protein